VDIVALRDIQEGEEIFIDYGPEWGNAWMEHQKQWKEFNLHTDSNAPLQELNMPENKNHIETREECASEPYPTNVATTCIYWETMSEEEFKLIFQERSLNTGLVITID